MAFPASSIPAVVVFPSIELFFSEEFRRISLIFPVLRSGLADFIRAAVPDTMGAAMEVPLI